MASTLILIEKLDWPTLNFHMSVHVGIHKFYDLLMCMKTCSIHIHMYEFCLNQFEVIGVLLFWNSISRHQLHWQSCKSLHLFMAAQWKYQHSSLYLTLMQL